MRFLILALFSFLAGCHNPCQDLCKEMASFAEDSCQKTLSDGEVRACIRDHTHDQLNEGDIAVCSEFADTISNEWECEDLEPYFESVTSQNN
jgi:hypothetical protein